MPMRDSSSLRVHDLRWSHASTVLSRHCNLSVGRCTTPTTVSISIRRKVRIELGPSILSIANGTPRILDRRRRGGWETCQMGCCCQVWWAPVGCVGTPIVDAGRGRRDPCKMCKFASLVAVMVLIGVVVQPAQLDCRHVQCRLIPPQQYALPGWGIWCIPAVC